MGFAKLPHVSWFTYQMRATQYARNKCWEYGHASLVIRWLQGVHRFAATVAGSRAGRLPFVIADAIQWRDTQWWHTHKGLKEPGGVRLRHATDWRGIHRKWDQALFDVFGSGSLPAL